MDNPSWLLVCPQAPLFTNGLIMVGRKGVWLDRQCLQAIARYFIALVVVMVAFSLRELCTAGQSDEEVDDVRDGSFVLWAMRC